MWRLERIVLAAVTGLAVAACNTPNAPGAAPTPTATNPQTTPSPAAPAVPDPALAFDRDGVALGEPADGQFAVYGDTAYYLRDDPSTTDIPSLVAADLTAGRPRWSKPIATDSMTDRWGPLRVAVLDGKPRLFISYLARLKGSGTQGDRELLRVIALEASDGSRVWTVDLDDDKMPTGASTRFSTFSPPSIVAATNDHIVLAIDNSALVLDAKNGTQRWGAADFQPAALDGSIVVGTAMSPVRAQGFGPGRSRRQGGVEQRRPVRQDRRARRGSGHRHRLDLHPAAGGQDRRGQGHRGGPPHLRPRRRRADRVLELHRAHRRDGHLRGKVLWELPDKSADRIMPRVISVRRGLIYATAGGNGPVILDARTGQRQGHQRGDSADTGRSRLRPAAQYPWWPVRSPRDGVE